MRALVLHGIGDLRLEEVPTPVPAAGEVLIRVVACGVCGSDIPRIFEKGAYRFPVICGHELAGLVAGCGAGVDDLEEGDRVTVFPLIWCGRCAPCERGQYAQCLHYDYLGSRSDGGFAEFAVAPRKNVLKVPGGVPLEVASMTEPAAVALHALRRAGGVAVGESVVIFGAGPIGMMVAQWAEISGAGKVILFDVAPDRCTLARQLGLRYCFNPRETQPGEVLADLTGGMGADVAVEAAGVPASLTACLEAVGMGGRVVLLGNPAAEAPLSAAVLSGAMRREITISGSWNSVYSAQGNRDDWQVTLQSIAAGALMLAPLISHRIPLARAIETLNAVHQKQGTFLKVIIQPVHG